VAAPSPSEVPGGLSEEEFAKLHTLREEGAPAAKGEMVRLADGTAAYLSLPEGAKAPVPGIVVIHEWWGLNEHIKHWADRLAADGYAALAVDLYGGAVAADREAAMAAMKTVDDARAAATVRAARRFLLEDPRVKAPRTASIGWCFGGGWSLRLALLEPDLDAAVVYYGHVPTDPAALAPLRANLLGVFGNQDTGIPPATVDAFEKALPKNGAVHRILRYDAPHAFANPSGPAYHPAEAAAAWAEVRAFLRAELAPTAGTPATAP
jgi:carboxymethylenebutenolidase